MNERLMILGAGVYQVPLIKKAKKMGLECIVVSPLGNYPGIQLADLYLDMDTTNVDGIVMAAKELRISGIVTTGTDVSVPSIGAVVDALDLRGPTQKTAKTVSSKTTFQTFLKNNRHNCLEFLICKSEQDAISFYNKYSDGVVIKPDDSSGSRSVSVIGPEQSDKRVAIAYINAKSYSRSGLVCAEKFIPGVEIGGDAFLIDGKVIFFGSTCKYIDGVIVVCHSISNNLMRFRNPRPLDVVLGTG